jgi:hypothetical protein
VTLYLVRWRDFTAALVNAQDEDDLQDRLDELGDTTGVTWAPYDGPLHFEFKLPIDFEVKEPARSRADVMIKSVPDDLRAGIEVAFAGTEASSAFVDALIASAFPNIWRAVERSQEKGFDYTDKKQLKLAALKDLDAWLKARWQLEQRARSSDPDAQIAQQLGASVRWVKSVRARAEEATTPTAPRSARRRKKAPRRPARGKK